MDSSKVFALKLDYHQDGRYFNGLLSKQTWLADSIQRTYLYDYDKSYRLTKGAFTGKSPENYSLPKIRYDANGNIDSLQRFGKTGVNSYALIDDLKYNYKPISNRLSAIDDNSNANLGFKNVAGTNEYSYNTIGDQKTDNNKGITNIEYNYLGLIDKVHFGISKRIENIYTSDGQKLSTKFINGSSILTKDYVGELIYINDTLRSIWHDEGRITFDNSAKPTYQYFINDHQGSTRVVFQALNNTTYIAQRIDYGVTGDIISDTSAGSVTTGQNLLTHLFQGKEFIDGFGFDFVTRTYDPYTVTMLQIDGANQFASGYTGLGNMPNMGVDPDGQVVLTTAVVLGIAKAAAIGAAIGGGIYTASVATSNGGFENWKWGQFAGSVGMGALNGALGHVAGLELLSFGKGFGLSLAPQVSFGSEGFSLGANLNLGYKSKFFQAGLTGGANVYQNNYTELSGIEGRIGGGLNIGTEKWGLNVGSMRYAVNNFSQTTSTIGFNIGGAKLRYENDFMFGVPFADGGDRWRTAALSLNYKGAFVGFNLFTGDPNIAKGTRPSEDIDGQLYYTKGTANKYRFGAAFVGYKQYRFGRNSEGVRHLIQNRVAHSALSNPDIPYFQILQNIKPNSYFRIGTLNPYSLW